MATVTRQRLVEAAVRRFYRDGFRNVGIDQILSLFMYEHACVPSLCRITLDPARPLTANLFVSYKTGDASS